MARFTVALLLLPTLLAAGCARHRSVPATHAEVAVLPEEGIPTDWRRVAHSADQKQLDAMPALWSVALTEAAKLDSRAIAQEGDLLRGDAALPRPMPTPGLYRCRTIRLGMPASPPPPRARALTKFKPFDCVISDEKTSLGFTKVSGTHRPGGYLWPDGDKRMIFLGGTAEHDGEGASAYGDDVTRNRAGALERIGEFRWRLTLLGQSPVARLEVIELVPAVAVPIPVVPKSPAPSGRS